jgi:hypothetical protein
MMPEKIWADYDSAGMCFWGIQKFDDKDTEYIRADIHAAEVERLNKALEQALRYEEWVYSDEKRCPELAAWLKENR